MHTLIGALVGIVLIAAGGDCCSCAPRHPQQHFCEADFVVLVGVLDIDVVYNNETGRAIQKHYIVNIKNVYKSSVAYENATKFFIASPTEKTACGIDEMTVGENYIVTGYISDDTLHTSYCDWVVPYETLTQTQKNGIMSKYETGCQCKFALCMHDNCGLQEALDVCEWEFGGRVTDCFVKHGACSFSGGECAWKETRNFANCEDNANFGGLARILLRK